MKNNYILILFFLFLGCKTKQTVSNNSAGSSTSELNQVINSTCAVPIANGVEGTITFLEGNVMPGEDGKVPEGKPVKREIWILPATKRTDLPNSENVFFQLEDNQAIAKQISESDGCYRINLEPGLYSVLVNEGDYGWFANLFDSNDFIQPVKVERGMISNLDIVINYKAAY